MSPIFYYASSFKYYRHMNLELGGWDAPIDSNGRKNIWAMLDGRIDNSFELAEKIKKKTGIHFESETDGELIVHAYEAWGEDFVTHLEGAFALALFDEEKQVLLIARDRIGQKTIYWGMQGMYFLFASEMKGLLATGIVPQIPSQEALASFLYFGFIPQDLTPIQGITKLLPAHYMKIDLNRQIFIEQYWSLSAHMQGGKVFTPMEVVEKFETLFKKGIQHALPSQGRAGVELKNELGSTALTWFLAHSVPREQISAYATYFEESDPQEREKIKQKAEMLSIPFEAKRIEPYEVMHDLPSIIWHLDEPIGDFTMFQTWENVKLAIQNEVLFSDLGWEEVSGGNPRYFSYAQTAPPFAFYLARLPKNVRAYFILPLLNLISKKYKYRVLRNIDINREQVSYLLESALFKGKNREKVSPRLYPYFDPEVFTQRFHLLATFSGKVNPSLYYDAKTRLPDDRLLQADRLSVPNHLRIASPFLYTPLLEFLAEIPEEIKFKDQIPASILYQSLEAHQKFPFTVANSSNGYLESWSKDARFREIFSLLQKGRLVDEGLISSKWIRYQLGYPYLISRTFKQLFSLLVLEVWFRIYIAHPLDPSVRHLSLMEVLKL